MTTHSNPACTTSATTREMNAASLNAGIATTTRSRLGWLAGSSKTGTSGRATWAWAVVAGISDAVEEARELGGPEDERAKAERDQSDVQRPGHAGAWRDPFGRHGLLENENDDGRQAQEGEQREGRAVEGGRRQCSERGHGAPSPGVPRKDAILLAPYESILHRPFVMH